MFRRISKYVRQFLGVSATESDRINPESILASQQEILHEQLSHYNRSLAASARFCDVLKAQIKSIEDRECSLTAALDSQTRPGASENTARELQFIRSELTDLRGQLEEAEAACSEITLARDAAVQAARKRLEELRGSLSEQQLRKALTEAIDRARTPE